jgi:MFS family permease
MATMADRAIIPGASKEFSAFLSDASDAPPIVRENPDAGLGILQAGFIGGYSVAIVLSSHYVHKLRWKTLVLVGLCVWWLAVLGSGAALSWNSYYVLLVARMASGVSEAAFHVVAPPLIQDRSGRDVGMWMSVYLCGMPVGLAVGYVYGSYMA